MFHVCSNLGNFHYGADHEQQNMREIYLYRVKIYTYTRMDGWKFSFPHSEYKGSVTKRLGSKYI